MAVLAIDIGNSTIGFGVFDGGFSSGRMDTHPLASPALYAGRFREFLGEKGMDKPPEGIVISSVVPGHTRALAEAARMLSGREPLVVGPDVDTGLSLDVENPRELGADRIAACVAAAGVCAPPLVMVDFGTATTVNFIAAGHVLRGGAILPGLGLMARSLSEGTARLPEAALGAQAPAVGRSTGECIAAGIVRGTAGAVERIIRDIEKSEALDLGTVVTGGFAGLVLPLMERECVLEPDLTLKGLRMIYERNAPGA